MKKHSEKVWILLEVTGEVVVLAAVVECTPDIIGLVEVMQCMLRWSRARLDRPVSRSVETDSLVTGDKETPGEDVAGDRGETGVGTM